MTEDDDTSVPDMPLRFRHAKELVAEIIEDAEAAGITSETVVSVMLCEALSRMIAAGGKGWTAAMLVRLADDLALGRPPDVSLQ